MKWPFGKKEGAYFNSAGGTKCELQIKLEFDHCEHESIANWVCCLFAIKSAKIVEMKEFAKPDEGGD